MRATLRMDMSGELYRAVESSRPLRPSCGVVQPPVHAHDADARIPVLSALRRRLEPRVIKASEPERLVCVACGFVFYLDPKIAVGTIIRTDGDRLVLVRRAIEPGYGKWVFPGGYVDRGEPLTVAAIREAREECGLDVRLDGLVNIYSYAGRAPVIVVYAATAMGGCCAATKNASKRLSSTEPRFPGTISPFAAPKKACATIWPVFCILLDRRRHFPGFRSRTHHELTGSWLGVPTL